MPADADPVCVMLLDGRKVDLYLRDAARLILWIAEHQDDLRNKGAWTFDHVPGSVCIKRTLIETLK